MNLEETLYYEIIKNGITENQIREYEKALENYPIENVDYFERLDNKLKLQAEQIRIFGKNDFGVIYENDKSAMEKAERNADTVKAYLDYKKTAENKTVSEQPKYINELIENGLIDKNMTVRKSLDKVALYIAKNCGINLSKHHLDIFINPKSNAGYSESAKKQAVNHALN